MTVRPRFEVASIEPGDNDDVPADEVALTVTFSTPVELDTARKAVTSTRRSRPRSGLPRRRWRELSRHRRLDTMTEYEAPVANITEFGQPLAKPYETKFKTGDARPRISMERGIYALEASAKGYPLWSRNIGKYEVECATIPKERLVAVLTTDMNYDPWGGNDDDKPLDWKALKLAPKKQVTKTTGKNKWLLNELELGKTCASAPGMRGMFLAEVSTDDIKPDPNRSWSKPRRNRVLANVTTWGCADQDRHGLGIVWRRRCRRAPTAARQGHGLEPGRQAGPHRHDERRRAEDPGQRDPEGAATARRRRRRRRGLGQLSQPAPDRGGREGCGSRRRRWQPGERDPAVEPLTEDAGGGATKIRGFIQSDRGLYRRASRCTSRASREIAQAALRVPRTKGVEIEVQDSRGQSVVTTKATLPGIRWLRST
jgi:hypothetical protein